MGSWNIVLSIFYKKRIFELLTREKLKVIIKSRVQGLKWLKRVYPKGGKKHRSSIQIRFLVENRDYCSLTTFLAAAHTLLMMGGLKNDVLVPENC